jgi:hypothetical protein
MIGGTDRPNRSHHLDRAGSRAQAESAGVISWGPRLPLRRAYNFALSHFIGIY